MVDKTPTCPNQQRNAENCPCGSDGCPRKGVCCECMTFHRERGQKPACMK